MARRIQILGHAGPVSVINFCDLDTALNNHLNSELAFINNQCHCTWITLNEFRLIYSVAEEMLYSRIQFMLVRTL